MTHDPSRKQFLGRLLGLAVAAGWAVRRFAGGGSTPEVAMTAQEKFAAERIKPETRAVARREGSV